MYYCLVLTFVLIGALLVQVKLVADLSALLLQTASLESDVGTKRNKAGSKSKGGATSAAAVADAAVSCACATFLAGRLSHRFASISGIFKKYVHFVFNAFHCMLLSRAGFAA